MKTEIICLRYSGVSIWVFLKKINLSNEYNAYIFEYRRSFITLGLADKLNTAR